MRNKKELNAVDLKQLKERLKGVKSMGIKERGEVIVEALEYMTTQEVAKATGKSSMFVNQYSTFHFLPQDIQAQIVNKEIGLVETLKLLAGYHHHDPSKYKHLRKDVKKLLEEKEAQKTKKAPKAKDVSEADLKRAYKNLNWIKEEIGATSGDKLNIMEKNILETLELALGNSKKKEIQDKIRKLTSTTAGRK